MVDYYDKVIAAIGASVVGGVLLGIATPIALHVGVFLGTLVATIFLYDAMFRNPPLPATHPKVAAPAVVWHAVLFVLALAVYFG